MSTDGSASLEQAYWQYYRLAGSAHRAEQLLSETYVWAWEQVEDLVHENPEEAVAVLVALADAAPNDGALAYLGAGPVEDLIVTGSAIAIDRIEGAARRNDRLRNAVRCAWFDDRVPAPVAARLRAFGNAY